MRWLGHPAVKPVVFVLWLLPAAWLVWAAFNDRLGANPAEALIRSLGDWSLRALVLVLLVTPLRVGMGWPQLARLRRMLGLFVFFYASLHWLAYAWFDMGFVWRDIVADVPKRPFILVGTLGWLLLLVLAATSFNRAIRWLGAARWQALHRSVYAVAALAVLATSPVIGLRRSNVTGVSCRRPPTSIATCIVMRASLEIAISHNLMMKATQAAPFPRLCAAAKEVTLPSRQKRTSPSQASLYFSSARPSNLPAAA